MKLGYVQRTVRNLLGLPREMLKSKGPAAVPATGAPFLPERPIPLPDSIEKLTYLIELGKKPQERMALWMPVAVPVTGAFFIPPPNSILGNAILRVSEMHFGRPNKVKMLTGLAEGVILDMKRKFPISRSIPSHVTVFIKGCHENLSGDVPAASYPFLDAIGILDSRIARNPSEDNLRWLMAQQISRLILSANTFGWDYTDKKMNLVLERRNELLNKFLNNEDELERVFHGNLIPIARDLTPKEDLKNPYSFTPKKAKDIETIVKKYLRGMAGDRKSLMIGFALGHLWSTRFCSNNNVKRSEINVFCMAIASALTGIAMEGPLEFFGYGEETRGLAGRTSINGDALLKDFFEGEITYLDLPNLFRNGHRGI